MNKKFLVEINILECLENENNDVLYLKRFYEASIGKKDALDTLYKGFEEVKTFIQDKINGLK